MTAFPLPTKQDGTKFGFEQEDVGLRSEMEGGFILTRPRHTRTPRRTWTTGFTGLTQTDKATFEAFVNEHGTFKAFDYTLPVVGGTFSCRFKEIPKYKYQGIGATMLWEIDCIIEEV
jgi:phage-related protein